jgi:hypothetical protein
MKQRRTVTFATVTAKHHEHSRSLPLLLLICILPVILSSASAYYNPTASSQELPATVSAAPTRPGSPDFQRGITFVSWQKGEYSTEAAEQSLADLASTGANWVAIIVTVYQKTPSDTKIVATERTATDDDLVLIISKAHELGLEVLLKPHVDIDTPGHWRGQIAFATDDDWQAWFTSYQQMINHYAELAKKTRTEAFCVGTELVKTSGRSAEWKRVVAEVRQRFAGKLTYASNHDEAGNVKWWSALDYIGVDAYYALPSPSDNPTVEELKAAWASQGHVKALKQLAQEYKRPVLLTEIGYRSVKEAHQAPWQWRNEAEIDLKLQANLYQAVLETFSSEEWVAGIFFWNWLADPNQGGANDPDYTPHGKPAEDVLRRFYGGSSNP